MKKADAVPFADFMLAEAVRYGRSLTKPEIDTWFETFTAKRVTLEDFKVAWAEHKKDAKHGVYFPNTVMVERYLRAASTNGAQRDWRCCEEVAGERCGFPGGINAGHGQQCRAHYHLRGTPEWSEASSLQIIELSRSYVPPRGSEELMARGAEQREGEGARWRKAHPELYVKPSARKPDDAIAPSVPAKPAPLVEPSPLDDVNAMAQLAAAEGGA